VVKNRAKAPAVVSSTGPQTRERKADHIRLALEDRMQLGESFFDEYRFDHCALPEIDFSSVDPSTTFLGKRLSAPLLISCMTGGNEEALRINRNLARAAEETGIAIGVGSQRVALEDESTRQSFRIRPFAPTVPVLANLGAVQLNYGFGADECRRAVEMVEADALVLHLNPLQEVLQPEGQGDFSDLLPKMAQVARDLPVPVIVKEVGCGISAAVARRLVDHGIRIVDTAGLGGTSWARIEATRNRNSELGEMFGAWGLSTPELIHSLRDIPGLTIIGSGGVRNGLDVAKALALGADLAGMAFPFLQAASQSKEQVIKVVHRTTRELRIAMFCTGAGSVPELHHSRLSRRHQCGSAPE
jgi:isopentenyl-diphosphate Delta-isomerase